MQCSSIELLETVEQPPEYIQWKQQGGQQCPCLLLSGLKDGARYSCVCVLYVSMHTHLWMVVLPQGRGTGMF